MSTATERAELIASEVTTAWEPPDSGPMFTCPGGRMADPECDCGHIGPWERRWVMVWGARPGHQRTAQDCLRDTARGFPPCPNDEGWWVVGGSDERCPACGDVERYDIQGNEVVVSLSRHGRLRRAERLQERADELVRSAWASPSLVDAPEAIL